VLRRAVLRRGPSGVDRRRISLSRSRLNPDLITPTPSPVPVASRHKRIIGPQPAGSGRKWPHGRLQGIPPNLPLGCRLGGLQNARRRQRRAGRRVPTPRRAPGRRLPAWPRPGVRSGTRRRTSGQRPAFIHSFIDIFFHNVHICRPASYMRPQGPPDDGPRSGSQPQPPAHRGRKLGPPASGDLRHYRLDRSRHHRSRDARG